MPKMFKEFPDIEIPEFLQTENWEDISWGNDAAPRMNRIFDPACPYELNVWVEHKDPKKREMKGTTRFAVVVYERATGEELDGTECRTENAAKKAAAYWESMILFLEANRTGNNGENNNPFHFLRSITKG